MEKLSVSWSSPSNIALVKYWGKIPHQIPCNPSVSFTLKNSLTIMDVEAEKTNAGEIQVDFFFEGKINEKFKSKIVKFLESERERFDWITNYKLTIKSENTFPHSSGIASSASSMSALCLSLLSLDEKITGVKTQTEDFYKEASDLSRRASGSAGRSVYPYLVSWGEIDSVVGSSNLFAAPVNKADIHPMFHDYCDSIMIVDAAEKSVSSRAGHSLMDSHPFRELRYKRAHENLEKLLSAMKEGKMEDFISIVEEDALMLHALMMTSTPSFILLKPMSLLLIEKIRDYRAKTNIPVCFTIDAGPNIHLLYPKAHETAVKEWLAMEFKDLRIIHDETGPGPVKIKD
ncbi:diphosphomevalonate decarboxylase [Bacteriovorax stolpii]|uniref:Diphosphomevalonate decarboxylase n=1 Tax=Bacteriovorax stolpii TaxID=960 RepID=A0A2K9NRM1_BACTC|nr:diphosphomevalonate decarboxylase [Bacteriovorax stolpii]AUN98159.1 diphosphomevalonate decarboxylase [Bacteriovorax stolpii]TDP52075.1 diphosphomevalonate decarboxylase [Bacteriovorax stolpii]